VRAQDHARRRGVERVPHIARGVVRRDVEQREVGVVILHVAAAEDLKAHLRPDRIYLAQRLGGRVQPANRDAAARQRHVERAFLQRAG